MYRLSILLAVLLLAPQTGAPNIRYQFLLVANRLRAFPVGMDFIKATDERPPQPGPGTSEYQALVAANYSVEELLPLLKDSSPKIRTLAAGVLEPKGDPRLLRYLAPLVDDDSPTFEYIDGPPSLALLEARSPKFILNMPPIHKPQTVASAALRLAEKDNKAGFTQYWASHANREYCVDWFLWHFRHKQFVPLAREQITRLPTPDRELTTLWIGAGRKLVYEGYSDAELLDAARSLGRDRVLAILRHQPPGTDPDIAPEAPDPSKHYAEMGAFLLSHAKELLSPSDAQLLLHYEDAERIRMNSKQPEYGVLWPVAAASLWPEKAASILNEAEKRYPHATEIPLARWRLNGQEALPEVLRWFYGSARAQESLMLAIERSESNQQYKPLVEALLASPGRLRIGAEDTYRVALLGRDWIAPPPPTKECR